MVKNFLLKTFKVKDYVTPFAKLISLVLNPIIILIPLPFYLIYKTTADVALASIWTLISFSFIFLFFIFILAGVKLKYFSDFDISQKNQRPLLYFVGIVLVAQYLAVMYFLQAPKVLFIVTLALALGLFILQLVNRYLKASAHTATLTAFVTSLTLVHKEVNYLLLWYALVILVAWSRVKLKRHTVWETAVGGILGGVLSIIVYALATRKM